jgi:hypothetical protein
MHKAENNISRGSELIFPVAVGAVFFVILVIGAIIG